MEAPEALHTRNLTGIVLSPFRRMFQPVQLFRGKALSGELSHKECKPGPAY